MLLFATISHGFSLYFQRWTWFISIGWYCDFGCLESIGIKKVFIENDYCSNWMWTLFSIEIIWSVRNHPMIIIRSFSVESSLWKMNELIWNRWTDERRWFLSSFSHWLSVCFYSDSERKYRHEITQWSNWRTDQDCANGFNRRTCISSSKSPRNDEMDLKKFVLDLAIFTFY